jgi:uncharacterized protein YjbI with pentapeptide repeats
MKFHREEDRAMRLIQALAISCVSLALLVPSYANAASYLTWLGDSRPIEYADGSGAHPYSGSNLEPGISASGADLSGASLSEANLTGADLSYGTLVGTRFDNALLDDSIFTNADLRNAFFLDADAYRADFSGADLRGANMGGSFLDALFVGANLSNTTGEDYGLVGADLTGASLQDAYCELCYLDGANFTNANLRGFHADNIFRFSGDVIDFSGADLTGAFLGAAALEGSTVSGANFSGATLNVHNLGLTLGTAFYDLDTDFSMAYSAEVGSSLFDPVAAGWTLIPEPGTAVLMALGLLGLGMGRRR